MIIKMIMNLSMGLMSYIINLIASSYRDMPLLGNQIADGITGLLNFSNQATNFAYFILGDAMYLVLPIALGLLLLKYTLIPVIILIRHHIIFFKGGT